MNGLRTALGIGAAAALAAGYAASQWAYVRGDAAAYSAAVDCPTIRVVALVVSAAAVASCFVRETGPGAEE